MTPAQQKLHFYTANRILFCKKGYVLRLQMEGVYRLLLVGNMVPSCWNKWFLSLKQVVLLVETKSSTR